MPWAFSVPLSLEQVSVRVLDTGVVELVQDRAGDTLVPAVPGDGKFGLCKIAGVRRPHTNLVELAASCCGGVAVDVDDVDLLRFGDRVLVGGLLRASPSGSLT